MKKFLFFSVFIIFVSCGGGSVGDVTINGDVNLNNNSNNNNTTNNTGAGSSSSSENESTALSLSVLYNPSNASSSEKDFIKSGLNIPITSFDNSKIRFMNDIATSEQDKAREALVSAAEIFGFFDINYFGLGSNTSSYESLKSDACSLFSYADCNSNNMILLNDVVANATSSSGSFLIGIESSASPSYLIYQGANSSINQVQTIDEYVHVFQNAVSLGMSGVPVWFKEGMAQYIAQWLSREKGYVSGSFSNHMDTLWDEAYSNRTFHTLQNQVVYKDAQNPLGFDAQKYGKPLWAIAYLIELANQRAGVSNGSQVILVDLVSEIRSKSWETAFVDNVGVSLSTFYTSFENVINQNAKNTRLTNLITNNVSSTIVPKYNYSVLQIEGASITPNNGGPPSAEKKSIYFYNADVSSIPSYQGSAWPYVRASSSATVTKEQGINAILEITNSNYVTIKSSANNARPVYQYSSDSESSFTGYLIPGWSAIDIKGNPVILGTATNIAPSFNNLPSSIAANENQTSVTTISVIDNDFNESITFSLQGTDSSLLSISNSGVLTFNSAPNFEIKNSYELIISISDGVETVSRALIINVQDVNEPPVINNLSGSLNVDENQTSVVTVNASDVDAGATLTYSLTGTDSAFLSITNSGVITFNSAPDYETKNSYSLSVVVSDGTNSVTQALIININDLNENPPFTVQLGSDLDGEAAGDRSGWGLDMNENGTIIAIGAPGNDGGGDNAGHVRTYQYSGGSWVQKGIDVNGDIEGLGWDVNLSDDGSIMIVSSPSDASNNRGKAQVYANSGGNWATRGSTLFSVPNENNRFVSDISGDGNTIVIAGRKLQPKVYKWNGSDYIYQSDLTSANVGAEPSAYSLDVSDDGNTIVVGYVPSGFNGLTRVFNYNGSSWAQIGSDIATVASGSFGESVAISSNGNHIAVGCISCGSNVGSAYVYSLSSGSWNQKGSVLNGDLASGQFGRSVSINNDATILAVGSNSASSGYVKIYKYESSNWQQTIDIDGESSGDQFGWRVKLSEDGEIVAISGLDNDGNGVDSGHVRVLD